MKYSFNDILLNANILSNESIIKFWNGLITMLSISTDAFSISSALFPRPVLFLIPKSIGDTTLWATKIFSWDSVLKNWYWLCASDSWIGSILAWDSVLSLNDRINLPALVDPVNLSAIFLSIIDLSSSFGIPLFIFMIIEGLNPFLMLFIWKFDTSASSSAYCNPPVYAGGL